MSIQQGSWGEGSGVKDNRRFWNIFVAICLTEREWAASPKYFEKKSLR